MNKLYSLLFIFLLKPIIGAQDIWRSVNIPGVGDISAVVATVRGSVQRLTSFHERRSASVCNQSISFSGPRSIMFQESPVQNIDTAKNAVVGLLKNAFLGHIPSDTIQSSLLDRFVAFRFSILGRNFEAAIQAFVNGLTADDIKKGIDIKPSELTFPKFLGHESRDVRSFAQMIDALGRDFYPNLGTFNNWISNPGYYGEDHSIEEIFRFIDYHTSLINEPGSSEETLQHSRWVKHHYVVVLMFKGMQFIPELDYLEWLGTQALTGTQTDRLAYINWILPQLQARLNQ